MTQKQNLIANLKNNQHGRASAWRRGVLSYAEEIADNLPSDWEYSNCNLLEKELLNGADSWNAYSWGGCSFCYDEDICEALATPSEQKRTKGGQLRPNSREEWLDVQARALCQACALVKRTARALFE